MHRFALSSIVWFALIGSSAMAQSTTLPGGPPDAKQSSQAAPPNDGFPDRFTTEDTRMTVGVESASASSSKAQFSYLLDFSLTAPLRHQVVTRLRKPRVGLWANIRLNGAPQAAVPSVKQFVGGFEKDLVSGNAQGLLRVANVLGGPEISIGRGFDFQDDYQLQPLVVLGAGFVTAPAPDGQPPVFDMTPEARDAFVPSDFPDAESLKYIGFIHPDRRNSYWQYYVGLRLRSHHFRNCEDDDFACSPDRRVNFPGTIDITFGQNAAVTGGRLSKRRLSLMRFDAFYPLPTNNLANAIYVFGSAFVQIGKAQEANQIILKAPSATVAIPSKDLYLHTLTEEERRRDLWSFGIGIDLVRLFKAAGAAPDPSVVGQEDGIIVADTARVRILRVLLKPGDSARLVPANDVLVPLTDAILESTVGESTNAEVWRSFQPVFFAGARRTLKNTSAAPAEALVIKRKEGPAFTGEDTKPSRADGLTRVAVVENSKLRVERLVCSKACAESGGAYSGLAVIVPVSEKGVVKVESEKSARSWVKGGTIIIEPSARHSFEAADNGEAILIKLK